MLCCNDTQMLPIMPSLAVVPADNNPHAEGTTTTLRAAV